MIYFVVLAYNEEENLPRLFSSVQREAVSLGEPYKILLVDDGSTDGTAGVAIECRAKMPIHIVQHESNLGVGEGFKTGFRSAVEMADDDDIVFTLEADNTSDVSLLPLMRKKIRDGADVVLGSCYAPGGSLRGVSLGRKVMSRGVNFLMQALFPIQRGHTYSSFYRAYRVDVIKRALVKFGDRFIVTPGFTSAAEILLKLRRIGAVIDEVPMVLQFDERKGKSKMKILSTVADYLVFLGREMAMELRHKFGKA